MIKLVEILKKIQFNNWIIPDKKALEEEYISEYKYHIVNKFGNIWKIFEDFEDAIENAEIKQIDGSFDRKIQNRSRTDSYEELIGLIKGYRSYPKYRNEKTVKAIYDGFKNNRPMKMSIILKKNTIYYIMSGNTRLDIAFQLGINPKILIVEI